ncbi:MAG TPA: class I SAM-dependent methyltransferase [Anaerolineales bacterium]|nr:class I SAM-dependent methyltransferase [Anaerolineales bacterium]
MPIQSKTASRDYLWLNLRELPYFRSMLRAAEAAFYQDLDLPAPLLDVGCGDGHFAQVCFDRVLDVGLDPWHGPIHEAGARHNYNLLTEADGGSMPFPDATFGCAVSNSVLEHIPDVEKVLAETRRVLKPGAPFVFCVPNDRFNDTLSVTRTLEKLRLKSLANLYRRFFTRISRHRHMDSPEVWTKRLEEAGFVVEKWWHYFSPRAQAALEWGHYFGLPSLVLHFFFRRWILVPTRWNLALTYRGVEPYAQPVASDDGVYTFYITRRAN